MKYLSTEEIRALGILQEVNRIFFHPLGLAAEVDLDSGTLRLQDHRDDSEGVIFAEGVMEPKKFQDFHALRKDRYASRTAALGFVHQPPPPSAAEQNRNAPNYEDKKKQREIRHIFSDIGLCGCGSTDKYELVRALLERADSKGWFYEPLGDVLNGRAVEFIADVMSSSHWDLLEHGSSVGGSWLTDKGQVLLQFFRDFGSDTEAWPDWWCSCDANEEW